MELAKTLRQVMKATPIGVNKICSAPSLPSEMHKSRPATTLSTTINKIIYNAKLHRKAEAVKRVQRLKTS